jgi:hypothetical protein
MLYRLMSESLIIAVIRVCVIGIVVLLMADGMLSSVVVIVIVVVGCGAGLAEAEAYPFMGAFH